MKKLILAIVLLGFTAFPSFAADKEKESVYERVLRTGTIRCGYGTWNPLVSKSLNTGEMEGLFVDMLEEMARISKIKIDWVAEVDWGQINTALQTGKIDAFCSAMWNDAARGKYLGYTRPFFHMSAHVFAREDDERFPHSSLTTISSLNKEDYAAAYTEGDVIETIIHTELPNVRGVALSPLGTPADNLMNLLTKKTDLVVQPLVTIQNYEKENGTGKIRLLNLETPLRIYGNVMAVDIHEFELLAFLNSAVTELVNSGSYDRILSAYDKEYPDAFIPVAKPYEVKK